MGAVKQTLFDFSFDIRRRECLKSLSFHFSASGMPGNYLIKFNLEGFLRLGGCPRIAIVMGKWEIEVKFEGI